MLEIKEEATIGQKTRDVEELFEKINVLTDQ